MKPLAVCYLIVALLVFGTVGFASDVKPTLTQAQVELLEVRLEKLNQLKELVEGSVPNTTMARHLLPELQALQSKAIDATAVYNGNSSCKRFYTTQDGLYKDIINHLKSYTQRSFLDFAPPVVIQARIESVKVLIDAFHTMMTEGREVETLLIPISCQNLHKEVFESRYEILNKLYDEVLPRRGLRDSNSFVVQLYDLGITKAKARMRNFVLSNLIIIGAQWRLAVVLGRAVTLGVISSVAARSVQAVVATSASLYNLSQNPPGKLPGKISIDSIVAAAESFLKLRTNSPEEYGDFLDPIETIRLDVQLEVWKETRADRMLVSSQWGSFNKAITDTLQKLSK